jgi:hypothetical protein
LAEPKLLRDLKSDAERRTPNASLILAGRAALTVGAVAALPLVAAYPSLERLWLNEKLEPEVVKDHQEQLRAA